jgi:hypothetical protein
LIKKGKVTILVCKIEMKILSKRLTKNLGKRASKGNFGKYF